MYTNCICSKYSILNVFDILVRKLLHCLEVSFALNFQSHLFGFNDVRILNIQEKANPQGM